GPVAGEHGERSVPERNHNGLRPIFLRKRDRSEAGFVSNHDGAPTGRVRDQMTVSWLSLLRNWACNHVTDPTACMICASTADEIFISLATSGWSDIILLRSSASTEAGT